MRSIQAQGLQAFSDYTTATAFVLMLNKNQATLLWCLARFKYQKGSARWQSMRASGMTSSRADFVQTVRGLIRRGLVVHNWVEAKGQPAGWSMDKHQWYQVTVQGMLVARLLEMAGVVQQRHVQRKVA